MLTAPIIIIGSGRSGSSLLNAVLNGSRLEMRDIADEIGLADLVQELGYADAPQLTSTTRTRSSPNGVESYDVGATASGGAPRPRLVRTGAARWRLVPAFPRESGNAWEFWLPSDCGVEFGLYADDVDKWTRSPLEMYEDDRLIGPAHAMHEYIRVFGGGAYSHWRDRLLFSSSDNSDPNVNGREYSICHLTDALEIEPASPRGRSNQVAPQHRSRDKVRFSPPTIVADDSGTSIAAILRLSAMALSRVVGTKHKKAVGHAASE